jgi:formylglycine-generating enzyme required for sulfatase activity
MHKTYLCLYALLLALLTAVLAGCGGAGTEDAELPGATGSVTFTVDWPARTRVLPMAAESVEVTLSGQPDLPAPQMVTRPAGDMATTQSISFDNVPAGTLAYTLTAYPQADLGGTPVGTVTGTVRVKSSTPATVTASAAMQSTVATLEIAAAGSTTLPIGGEVQLTATAKDAQQRVLLLWPGQLTWTSTSTNKATVEQTGRLHAHEIGDLQITVQDAESTRSAQLTLHVTPITRSNPQDGATMVWVPGGSFTMGSPDDIAIYHGEQPQHTVTLSGYWMYQHEITVAQYRAFCTATGHALPEWPNSWLSWTGKSGWTDPALQQHPIINIAWADAKAYADWAGVQLPTESQWEYTARGSHGYNYPWGGMATAADFCNGWSSAKCANYRNSFLSGKSTWPVGSFLADTSWCGVQDLAGNAAEWCADWYGTYPSEPVTDPTGPDTGDRHVRRGGMWFGMDDGTQRDSGEEYRNTNRDIEYLDVPYLNYAGIRCVAAAPAP